MLDPTAMRIVAFVEHVGLSVTLGPIDEPSVMPGITIRAGTVVIDPAGLLHAGDVLHEAGHLAVLPPSVRQATQGRLDAEHGNRYEVGVLCWSYAACVHLGLEAEVVFHPDGYRGQAQSLADTFRVGGYVGLPVLQEAGLVWPRGRAPAGEACFPAMRRWVCVDEPGHVG